MAEEDDDPFDGTAEPIIRLVVLDKKSEVQKLCRTLVIRQNDFVEFILASELGRVPWYHRIHHREYRPAHLEPTDEELAGIGMGKIGEKVSPLGEKFMRKVVATFEERRLVVGHMFWTQDQSNWHFFYFDQRDTQERANHWSHGAHIHYLSDLWPNRTAKSVWEEFVGGNPQMKNSLHIRWHEPPDVGPVRLP